MARRLRGEEIYAKTVMMMKSDGQQRASKAAIGCKTRLTSIKQTFKYELMFVRLCGGFMFDTNKYARIVYRLLIVGLTQLYTYQYNMDYQDRLGHLVSKAALQNLRLFWFTLDFAWVLALIGTVVTGMLRHNLFSILLNKQFDERYLMDHEDDERLCTDDDDCDAGDDNCDKSELQFKPSQRNAFEALKSSCNEQSEQARRRTCIGRLRCKLIEGKREEQQQNERFGILLALKVKRTKMLRLLLICYVISSALLSQLVYEREFVFAGPQGQRVLPWPPLKQQQQQQQPNSTSLIRSLSDAQERITTATAATTTMQMNSSATSNENFIQLLLAGGTREAMARERARILAAAQAATAAAQQAWKAQANQTRQWVPFMRQLAEAESTSARLALHAARFFVMLLVQLVRCSLVINQMFGQVFVAWMVTATLTDMLEASSKSLECNSDMELRQRRRTHSKRAKQRAIHRTTELLIQARDALIVLRRAMDYDYLVLLIFNMIRLMSSFCLFSALISTEHSSRVVLAFLEYVRVTLGILIIRLGYHDLHARARLIRVTSERQLIEQVVEAGSATTGAGSHRPPVAARHVEAPFGNAKELHKQAQQVSMANSSSPVSSTTKSGSLYSLSTMASSLHSSATSSSSSSSSSCVSLSVSSNCTTLNTSEANDKRAHHHQQQQQQQQQMAEPQQAAQNERAHKQRISRTEATTAYRLARDIEELWPTTWFTPDLRSYVSQNVFVITFVATLQQLVEASAKIEFQGTAKGPSSHTTTSDNNLN